MSKESAGRYGEGAPVVEDIQVVGYLMVDSILAYGTATRDCLGSRCVRMFLDHSRGHECCDTTTISYLHKLRIGSIPQEETSAYSWRLDRNLVVHLFVPKQISMHSSSLFLELDI